MAIETSKLKVRCPICKEWARWADNPYRPFCSENCKKSDLGNWASERYTIPEPLPDDPETGLSAAGKTSGGEPSDD